MAQRSIKDVVRAIPTSDGAGVRLARSLGTPKLEQLDPFLMLDEFRSDNPGDYIAGFPAHPHRGFETVTIMLAGSMQHKDSTGNTGDLRAGSVQWMTAGRGIIHSEMPQQEDGLMWGFQLWVNLPAKDKMTAPRYQDVAPTDIPEVVHDDAKVRVVAGTLQGVIGPVGGVATDPIMFDVLLPAGKRVTLAVPESHNAFVYPFEGSAELDGRHVERGHLVVTARDGDEVEVLAGEEGSRFLLVAGRPIGEPVARYGPFVMNTEAELHQAVKDYRAGRLA